MAQFDSPTEAALARLKSENLSSSTVDGKAEKAATLGGIILEAVGFTGASQPVKFLSTLKSLAADKDEGNLIYFGEALVDDIRRLYRLHEESKNQFDQGINSPEFNAAVANATLHITRTNVESRLKRLAHLITNGVRVGDLETESLDDMMRAAVELTARDVIELGVFMNRQSAILAQAKELPMMWYDNIRRSWQSWAIEDSAAFREGKLSYFELNSSRSKLAASGFIIAIPPAGTTNSPDAFPYALLPEGARFLERLQEIGTK
jgi:hypothetical protein